ncbi:hypothetical protein BH09BAC5_BH09BAC5_12640 [soil metagenome]
MSVNNYNGEAIRKMTALFMPFNSPAYNWLMEKGFRELTVVAEFIQSGKEKDFQWLIDQKFFDLAAFANAAKGDKKAFQWLMQHNHLFWAATANAVNKDPKAMAWLREHKFIVYAELAEAIIEYHLHDNSDFSGYYKAPQ